MKIRKRVFQSRASKAGKGKALLAMLALCFVLTSCGGEADMDSENGRTEDTSSSGAGNGQGAKEDQASEDAGKSEPTGPVEVGDDYRDFTATLADGSSFTLSDHAGTVILLNFWATWCGPCVGEMPAFPMLVEKYGDDLTLLAVNLGENAEGVQGFLEKKGYGFPVALDPELEIGSLYPSDGIPYTVLIGKDGKIASIHLGADKADIMYEFYCGEIDELLEAEAESTEPQ